MLIRVSSTEFEAKKPLLFDLLRKSQAAMGKDAIGKKRRIPSVCITLVSETITGEASLVRGWLYRSLSLQIVISGT